MMGRGLVSCLVVIGTALLASCDKPSPQNLAKSVAMQEASAPSPPAMRTLGAVAQQDRRIAVSHNYVLRFPQADLQSAQKAHMDACLKLDCSVVNSVFTAVTDSYNTASLSVRVGPDAFEQFLKAVLAPPAHIVSHSETADDKTIAMLDVEARLNSKKSLRDELLAMKKQPGKASLADLLSIERELATVQGEIEAGTAQYAYLKTLTDTIKIDISYQTEIVPERLSDFAPIAESVHRIRRTFADSVAALISFLAGAAPWLPILAGLVWGLRLLFHRWRRKGD